jgi:hypothetical protein
MPQVKPLIVLGSEGLQQAFNEVAALTVTSGSTVAPTTQQEAVEWINAATTTEMRSARKLLAHGVMYGSGVETFKRLFKND